MNAAPLQFLESALPRAGTTGYSFAKSDPEMAEYTQ